MTCKETARLISESLDHEISWYKHLSMKLHLALCSACTRYKQQLSVIKKISKFYGELSKSSTILPPSDALSEEAKGRIKATLRKRKSE